MKRLFTVLMPLIGLGVFALIVARTGPGRIAGVLAGVDPARLAWAPLLVVAIALTRGLRWRVVVRRVGIDYSLARSTLVWTIGFFASSVTPAKVGDAVRALYLRTDARRPLGEAFLTVFVDRLWDLGFILVAGVASGLVFSRRYIEIPSGALMVAAAVLLGGAAYAATNRAITRAILRPLFGVLVPARHREGLTESFHTFYDALRVYANGVRVHAAMLALTLLSWALIFTLAVYVAGLLELPMGVGYLVLIMPIITLVELLPFSVSGLGTRDATAIYFFSVVGIGGAEAVGFSIAYVLIGTYLTAIVGFALWLRHPLRWREDGQP